ncbi:MAG: ferrochelatase [Alphaproteobacteria bacterium CG_4_10_14_0_8_um_filter_53_9]|nr:MAG: ferrochelatase [Alphaproteobacteria bacterium CG_4_10_14_0_8_um_filter_53_9]
MAKKTPARPQQQTSHLPQGHPPVPPQKVGVLYVNLGTPDNTGYFAMRRYLKEFLSDRRVIDLNPVLWSLLLNVIILTKRPFTSGHAYKTIWNTKEDESPLLTFTKAQCKKLQEKMKAEKPGVECAWAMRYGNPSIAKGIDELRAKGCQKILLFALYPQYSAPTSATVYDKAFDHLKTLKWQPAIRTVPSYHDHPAYIQALANSVQAHVKTLSWTPDLTIASFHGVPKRYLLEGDPYHCFCQKTGRLLREKLGIPAQKWLLSFQSRFGTEEWLKPYTDKELIERTQQGKVKNVLILAPGFVADCIETLEELNIRLREDFMAAGGKNFSYVPCLNSTPDGIDVLAQVTLNELSGW